MTRIYLDYNATAPLRDEAREAMIATMGVVGNPSSVHAEGRGAKAVVERARAQVAQAVGCHPDEVIFTGGATEAASVLARFLGRIDVEPTAHDALWAHRREGSDQGSVYAMGLANSETGMILSVPERGEAGVGPSDAEYLLLDVTQAIGRIPFSFAWSGADMAILSAHKLGGPKGVGALVVRRGLEIAPILEGGGQEMGRRSGTENILGIVGFGAAIEAAQRDLEAGVWENVSRIRKILELALETAAKETIFVGNESERLPNTSCIVTPGWKGETQVMQMDLAGFAISSGSACSSGKVKPSRVLKELGFDAEAAQSAIRVSLGPLTTEDDIRAFADVWLRQYEKFRQRAGT